MTMMMVMIMTMMLMMLTQMMMMMIICMWLVTPGRVTCHLGAPISDFAPSDEPMLLLVAALRFTHHTVNAELAFGEDHENCQASIFQLLDALFRGHLHPEELEPLYVFLHPSPSSGIGAARELLMSEARPRRVQGDAESSGNCIAFLQPRAFQRLAGAHHGERAAGCE